MSNMESRPLGIAERLISSIGLNQSETRGSNRFWRYLKSALIGAAIGSVLALTSLYLSQNFFPSSAGTKDLIFVPVIGAIGGLTWEQFLRKR